MINSVMRVATLMIVVNLFAALIEAQTTPTCREWFEPKTYQDAIVAEADPRNDRPAVIFGDRQLVPPMRIRMVDGDSGRPLPNRGITVNYGWRWLQYPYPEHASGAWSETADQLKCDSDSEGWLETPPHNVQPRGWYAGKYTRFPWLRHPQFTGVGIVALTPDGVAAIAELPPGDLSKFHDRSLVIRVFDGFRTEISWESNERHGRINRAQQNSHTGSTAADRVAAFLRTWLVDRKPDAAIASFFSSAAFENRVILSESCVGGVGAITTKQARNRVRKFLMDFSKHAEGATMQSALNLNTLIRSDGWADMRKRAMNDPERDHFVLFEATRDMASQISQNAAQQAYLMANLPEGNLRVALVPVLRDGLVYIIWTGDSSQMRIYHMGMFCM